MGMFDYITYKGREFQTRDTPAQLLDRYEIRDDGTLWHENYDCKWVEDKDALFGGYLDQYNKRWEQVTDFKGEIVFYDYNVNRRILDEYSAYFVNGKMENFQIIYEGKTI